MCEFHLLFIIQGGSVSNGGKRGVSFTEAGFPDDLFDDLESLEYFSNFINAFSALKARWFEGTPNLEVIVIFLNGVAAGRPPLQIEEGVLKKLPNLIDFSSYSSTPFGFPSIPDAFALKPNQFEENPDIKVVGDGTQFLLAPEALRNALGLPHPLGDDRELNPRYPSPPVTLAPTEAPTSPISKTAKANVNKRG